MPDLVVDVRFPLGEFQAHDERGSAEWPPSPARLASATLATAYGRGEGVEVARAMFGLAPPTMVVPRSGERAGNVTTWVRVDADLDLSTGRIERGGLTGTISKPARRGTTVADGCVSYVFADVPLDPAELGGLQAVMAEIPYLGRPTSPAVVDAYVLEHADVAAMSKGREVWSPAEQGSRRVRVATSGLLAALDKREAQRRAFGRRDFTPRSAPARWRPMR